VTVLRAALFDLDGTLVDSAPDLKNALNMTLRTHKRRDVTLDEVKEIVGDGMLTTLERAFAMTGKATSPAESYERFQEFIMHYRGLKADIEQIYPDVVPMLENLSKAGVKLGLCTNKHEASTHQLLEQLNLKKYFSSIAGGDTFQVHKPHPGHVTGILDELKVSPAQAIMVGDSRNDVNAAKAAGVATLVVTHGYGLDVGELGADGLIDSFADFNSALAELGFRLS
jgi:phosphoglycolate phosphatase